MNEAKVQSYVDGFDLEKVNYEGVWNVLEFKGEMRKNASKIMQHYILKEAKSEDDYSEKRELEKISDADTVNKLIMAGLLIKHQMWEAAGIWCSETTYKVNKGMIEDLESCIHAIA